MKNLKSSVKTCYSEENSTIKNENLMKMSSPIINNNISSDIKALNLSQNLVSLSFFRKMNLLYSSILEAQNTLLKYKQELSTLPIVEDHCITPLTKSSKISMLFYKREDLTSIHAYKIRGALYQTYKIIEENKTDKLNFIAASTGNHALGVLKAAEILDLSTVTIYVSENISRFKLVKLERRISELRQKGIDAKLVVKGKNFDETNKIAQEAVSRNKQSFFIDPYNNSLAVAGQGTIGLELLLQLDEQISELENSDKLKELTVIVPIGGGGLISGIACALKAGINNFPRLKKLKLTVVGVKLDKLNSLYGDAIKVKVTGEHNKDYLANLVEKQILIEDKDMKKGIDFVSHDIGVKVEGASAGTLKPLFENIVKPSETNAVVCVLSGSNVLA